MLPSDPSIPVPPRMLYWEDKYRGEIMVAGLDEAGRGPLAGPVVAGAAILPSLREHPVAILDSKKLTPTGREKAFEYLTRLPGAVIGVGVVDQTEIDRINILQATRKAMSLAVEHLSISPGYLLIDGLIKLDLPIPQQSLVRGEEKSVSIAAASIIAKVTRDRIMEEYDREYPVYGFARHKGYGTKLHLEMLKKHGPCPIHRFSFSPVSRLK
jgi:ribonuclease HII